MKLRAFPKKRALPKIFENLKVVNDVENGPWFYDKANVNRNKTRQQDVAILPLRIIFYVSRN